MITFFKRSDCIARISYSCIHAVHWERNNSLSWSVRQAVHQSMSGNLVFAGNYTGRVFHRRGWMPKQ